MHAAPEHRQPALAGVSAAVHALPDAEVITQAVADAAGLPAWAVGKSVADLRSTLQSMYSGTVGAEFLHCETPEERQWMADALEASHTGVAAAGADPTAAAFAGQRMSLAQKRNAHSLLQQADAFENFLARKYETLKRYSGEGTESLLPALDTMFAHGAEAGWGDVVIGQAHRGRLALLVSLLQYPARKLFRKLKGLPDIPTGWEGLDDVSSHVAVATNRTYGGKSLHVTLLHNPSHLEAVNPVAVGKTRAKRESHSPGAACVLIHGDAAVSGQGVVAETAGMAGLPGYSVGGTLHIVTNNQLGFTAHSEYGRSTTHASDVLKLAGAPVLHVNAEDMEGVVRATRIACAFRDRFGKDAVINLMGFRRHGHNELDDPSMTSPDLYAVIGQREGFPAAYTSQLLQSGELTLSAHEKLRARLEAYLQSEYDAISDFTPETGTLSAAGEGPLAPAGEAAPTGPLEAGDVTATALVAAGASAAPGVGDYSAFRGKWAACRQARVDEFAGSGLVWEEGVEGRLPRLVNAWCPDTGVPTATLQHVAQASVSTPEGFTMHDRLQRMWAKDRLQRAGLAEGKQAGKVDWATAETMAFGSLLLQGADVRLSGQDCQRGTFAHRHAVLVDQTSCERFAPLNAMPNVEGDAAVAAGSWSPGPAHGKLDVWSSHLSEFAVMGFEYGYGLESAAVLPMWEAQFGDFGNGAQIIIDNFLAGSESKWLRQSGLTLLLPHGFDGAGPEHSSCRMERYLQNANGQAVAYAWPEVGQDKAVTETANWSVINPTTPANYFHALRRQMVRPFRKPMVVVGPKTLLRLPAATSTLEDMAPGTAFQPVLQDTAAAAAPEDITRVILCSGKVYYDLLAARTAAEGDAITTAIVRVEELCPFPAEGVAQALGAFLTPGEEVQCDLNVVGGKTKGGVGKAAKPKPRSVELVWAQEEPANAGAWSWVRPHLLAPLQALGVVPVGKAAEGGVAAGASVPVKYVGRPALATTAVGLGSHNKAQGASMMAALWGAQE